jgi:integrase
VHAPGEASSQRLGDYLNEEWWPTARLAHSTRLRWASLLNRWIIPYIGQVRLRDLGSQRIREWQREIAAADCSEVQANRAKTVLSTALSQALQDGLLGPAPMNPCHLVRKYHERATGRRALTPIEVERIRSEMASPYDRLMVSLLFYAGLRVSEAFGLRWRSVGPVLFIDESTVDGRAKDTKTHRPRIVTVVAPLAEELAALRPRVLVGDERVIATGAGGQTVANNWRKRVFTPARERAGVARATPGDGRTTFASLLIHEGRTPAYVQNEMGHSSSKTTHDNYVRWFREAQLLPVRDMADAIAAARHDVFGGLNVADSAPLIVLRGAP